MFFMLRLLQFNSTNIVLNRGNAIPNTVGGPFSDTGGYEFSVRIHTDTVHQLVWSISSREYSVHIRTGVTLGIYESQLPPICTEEYLVVPIESPNSILVVRVNCPALAVRKLLV
jgi:hypothetical protein